MPVVQHLLRHIRLIVCVGAFASMPVPAAVFKVGTPVGAGQCTHSTIQSALDAAAASPVLDIIRVTRGTYVAQRLVVNDASDVAIEGGFLECATLVFVDNSTLDGGAANPPGPVIRHIGSGNLTLSDLKIQNGVAFGATSTTTFGGGVSSTGSGNLTLYRSAIQSNRARSGGGMFVSLGSGGNNVQTPAGSGGNKDLTLAGVTFANNEAVDKGGGLYLSQTTATITSDEVNYFSGNRALGTDIDDGGGGIYAVNSSLFVSGQLPAGFPFMDGNWTNSNGGAIYFAGLTPSSYALILRNRSANTPMLIAANTASGFGGAIYMRASAVGGGTTVFAGLNNVIISNNLAPQGAALYLYGEGSDSIGNVSITMASSLAGDSTPICSAQQRCNRIDANVSNQGAPIVLEEGGSQGQVSFDMTRGYLLNNIAVNGGGLIFAEGSILIDNSVLANNDAGASPLIDNGGGNVTRVQNSTLSENIRVPALFKLASANDDLFLHNSIAYQPNMPLVQDASGSGVSLRNLLIGIGTGLTNLASRNIQETTDPMFENPAQGDFRLRLGSQAINRWSPGGGVNVPTIDLLGAARPAPATGSPTPYDFGAYEFGAVVDPIFSDSFENN